MQVRVLKREPEGCGGEKEREGKGGGGGGPRAIEGKKMRFQVSCLCSGEAGIYRDLGRFEMKR